MHGMENTISNILKLLYHRRARVAQSTHHNFLPSHRFHHFNHRENIKETVLSSGLSLLSARYHTKFIHRHTKQFCYTFKLRDCHDAIAAFNLRIDRRGHVNMRGNFLRTIIQILSMPSQCLSNCNIVHLITFTLRESTNIHYVFGDSCDVGNKRRNSQHLLYNIRFIDFSVFNHNSLLYRECRARCGNFPNSQLLTHISISEIL